LFIIAEIEKLTAW